MTPERGRIAEALEALQVGDWPKLIQVAKAWGCLPPNFDADDPGEYEWKGEYEADARHTAPTRQRLVAAVAARAAALLRSEPVGITEEWLRQRFPWISLAAILGKDEMDAVYREVADALCSVNLPVGEPVAEEVEPDWSKLPLAWVIVEHDRWGQPSVEHGAFYPHEYATAKVVMSRDRDRLKSEIRVEVAAVCRVPEDYALPAPPAAPEAQEPEREGGFRVVLNKDGTLPSVSAAGEEEKDG